MKIFNRGAIRTPVKAVLLLFMLGGAQAAQAGGTYVSYPDSFSSGTYFTTSGTFFTTQPAYLKPASPPDDLVFGTGDDGYVTVTAEIDMLDKTCASTGKKGATFLKLFEQKMQIAVSLKTNGFNNGRLDDQDIPIATFDGRNDPGGCAILSRVPMTIIPYARLDPFSGDGGDLRLYLNVRSTTDVNTNLVAAGQVVLTSAAVFATGGAATTVASLSATLAKPALGDLQRQVDATLSNNVPNQTRIAFNWQTLRKGINPIIIPVRLGTTSHDDANMQATITRLQQLPAAERPEPLFQVTLKFSYTKTLFDPRVVGRTQYPKDGAIAANAIVNYPLNAGVPNFIQTLNNATPSLQSAIATKIKNAPKGGVSLTRECAQILETLDKTMRLTMLDRVIVLKSFIDTAQNEDDLIWSSNLTLLNSCFSSYGKERGLLNAVYAGNIGARIRILEAANLGAASKWSETMPLILDGFRRVFEGNDPSRTAAFVALNSGKDPVVEVNPFPTAWSSDPKPAEVPAKPGDAPAKPGDAPAKPTDAGPKPPETPPVNPNARLLAARNVLYAGCYLPVTDEAKPTEGMLVLVVDSGDASNPQVWIARVTATGVKEAPYKVLLFKSDSGWAQYILSNDFPAVSTCKTRIFPILQKPAT